MPNPLPPIVLASESPRRRALLETLGLSFTVVKPGGEEAHPLSDREAGEVTCQNALVKAESVARGLKDPKSIVIGADTLVIQGGSAIGKPADAEAARATLRRLSGVTHEVVTGLALVSPERGSRKAAVVSKVTFRKLSPEEVENYVSTREPYDKAGAYGVQGLAMLFIDRIEGSYTNVMGLPMERFLTELGALTGIPPYQWFLP
jgi:septum formation protein